MALNLDSVLSASLKGYEHRPGQGSMAEAVREALVGGERLIVEAGTGTGKSLAYLIPLAGAALENETRAVVSTYTKALQRQLVEKELPFVRDNLPGPLSFALCLGSENYLCLRRLEQARTHGLFNDESEELGRLLEWAAFTESGIREKTPWELWRRVARESDLCTGKDCAHHGRCFYQRARETERRSSILVVNHHLYFANLASGGRVLPNFSMAVFDEAHELEDVASGYLSTEASSLKVKYILSSILGPQGKGLLSRLRWLEPARFSEIASMVNSARIAADKFFGALSDSITGRALRIRTRGFVDDVLSGGMRRLSTELDNMRGVSRDEEERKELGAASARCGAVADGLRAVLMQELEGHVYWAEDTGRTVRLVATPVEVSGMDVFGHLEAAVFTSATLSTGGGFSYIKERLGLEDARTLLIKSHFDYSRQAALYIAEDLPEPNTPAFEEKALERVSDMLRITGGRTLVLFTSHALLAKAARTVSPDGVDILRQGEAESYRLLEEFRSSPNSAIFGTYTFWQGIDLPGEALNCVIITKLPFAAPDEPVAEARMEALERLGKDSFVYYQIPRAAIMLKQGFGRLIRTSSDTGVVAILDPRVKTRRYGKILLDSLPLCRVISSLDELGAGANAV